MPDHLDHIGAPVVDLGLERGRRDVLGSEPDTPRTDVRDPSAPDPAGQPADPSPGHPATAGPAVPGPGDQAAPADLRAVAHLIPAARAARTTLAGKCRPVSRDALAAAMRGNGHRVSNAHASFLLKILKAGQDVTPVAPTG